MERPMFNRLPEYTRNELLTEYNISNIREVETWTDEDRIPLKNQLRQELNTVLSELITDLDDELLVTLLYILKKHWDVDTIDIATMSDLDCILLHNYLRGIHLIN